MEEDLKWKYLKEAQTKLREVDNSLKKKFPYNHLLYQMIDLYGAMLNPEENENEEESEEKELRKKDKIKVEFYKEFMRGFSLLNGEYVNIEFVEQYLKKNLRR